MTEKYNLEEHLEILREHNDIITSASYGTKHSERITIELLDANRKTNEKLNKTTEGLIAMLKNFNESSTKLSKRMYYLTIGTATIAIMQIVVAVIAIVKNP